eukprot:CAMPEP_0174320814 /NCGR_PEP_ID=MMETSP0810-20121108/9825_1 /TAXON_ID=73025 ORGANISM="Eutreptiella gymnastica-like, Strain CCMP1594" /NCGR_SAMPLE_ID=MMETSP0810 /ASSEMBLY_ACC=CAM_ASM_000659 /LENGTH=863 /DNA_ID=CAMNT_0015431901 /DNA_START=102 /DNA_END=2693 /DNA_ORIENTATION=-
MQHSSESAKWYYQQTGSGHKVRYPIAVSNVLERAFQRGDPEVKVNVDGHEYKVQLEEMRQFPVSAARGSCEGTLVDRVPAAPPAQSTSRSSSLTPPYAGSPVVHESSSSFDIDPRSSAVVDATTESINKIVAMQKTEQHENFYKDMFMCYGYSTDEERAAALASAERDLCDSQQKERVLQSRCSILRMVQCQLELSHNAQQNLEADTEEQVAELLQGLDENVTDSRADDDPAIDLQILQGVFNQLENVGDGQFLQEFKILVPILRQSCVSHEVHVEALSNALSALQRVQALPGTEALTDVVEGSQELPMTEVQALSEALARLNGEWSKAQDKVPMRNKVQASLGTYADIIGRVKEQSQKANECLSACTELEAKDEDIKEIYSQELGQARRTQALSDELQSRTATFKSKRAECTTAAQAETKARLQRIHDSYERIELLRQQLAAEHCSIRREERELLHHVSNMVLMDGASHSVEEHITNALANVESRKERSQAEAGLADLCLQANQDITKAIRQQAAVYQEQLNRHLVKLHVDNWTMFLQCSAFVEHFLRQAQKNRHKTLSLLQDKERLYQEWKELNEPEDDDVTDEDHALNRSRHEREGQRWQQELTDAQVHCKAKEREVDKWLAARKVLDEKITASGTKEALQADPQYQAMLIRDPRLRYQQTDSHMECQAGLKSLLLSMRQAHEYFGEFYEEAKVAVEDVEEPLDHFRKCSVQLKKKVQELLDTQSCPAYAELLPYLRKNPYMQKQIRNAQKHLEEDLSLYSSEVALFLEQPCGSSGESIMLTWTSALKMIDGLLEPVGPLPSMISSRSSINSQSTTVDFGDDDETYSETSGDSFFDLTNRLNSGLTETENTEESWVKSTQ